VGDKIPWDEPGFSERMLREHLSQAHDAASRKADTIGRHVDWIHRKVLRERPTSVLDVGCGPGLYTSRLAAIGHRCTGIDFSPASIEYARDTALREGLACDYEHRDATEGSFASNFGLAMMVFGELNAFRREAAAALLADMQRALSVGGQVLIEMTTLAFHDRNGMSSASWHTAASGWFSDTPYLCLREFHWSESNRTSSQRDWIVDIETGGIQVFTQTAQAYADDEASELIESAGFFDLRVYGSLDGEPHAPGSDMLVVVANKR
jgi:ubiquinone/menaquinone biosynthesis C-methylase UbiE